MAESRSVVNALALAFLAGEWHAAGLRDAASTALGERLAWVPPLVRRVLARFPEPPHDDLASLRATISSAPALAKGGHAQLDTVVSVEARMGLARWPVPTLATSVDLAAWLGITDSELDWLADPKGLNRHPALGALQHYVFRWLPKRSGGHRLLESPKSRLKALQRKLLRELLDLVPPHPAAHGFVRGRSALSLAREHSARPVVLRMDLEQFFASVGSAKVRRTFRTLGYPDNVAPLLTGLCTTLTPYAVLDAQPMPARLDPDPRRALEARFRTKQRLAARHLPQGAPTSPALANLAAYRMDLRLARAATVSGAHYGRYADDLFFSGDRRFARSADRFETLVAAIALDEGFRINHRKTQLMRDSSQQRVLGLVSNHTPAVSRAERDTLEAILTNCVRHGSDSQNREGRPHFLDHLRGRIAWVRQANPAHAAKLEELLARIVG